MRTYLVGGAVRDELLGLVPTERDWVVVGSSEALMLAAGFRRVGHDFPVFLHPGRPSSTRSRVANASRGTATAVSPARPARR